MTKVHHGPCPSINLFKVVEVRQVQWRGASDLFKTFVSQNLGDSLIVSKAWLSKRQVPQDLGDFSRNVDGDCCRHPRAINKTCISSHRQNIKVLRQTLGKLAFLAKVWVSISCQHLQVKHVRPTSELLNWAFQILTRLIS